MTVEEAIRQHKAAVRRVGRGKPYTCSEEAQRIYKAAYLENKYGNDGLSDEDKKVLEEARS